MKRNSSILGSAILVNCLQLLLCVVIYTINKAINVNTLFLSPIFFIIELFIWFVIGFRFVISYTDEKISSLIIALLFAIAPILVYTLIAFILSVATPVAEQGWGEFFFALSPVVFINRPALFLARIFSGNGYVVFFLNCVFLAVAFYVGEILALGFKTGKKKINNRKSNQRTQEIDTSEVANNAQVNEAQEQMPQQNTTQTQNTTQSRPQEQPIRQSEQNKQPSPQQNTNQPKQKPQTRSQLHAQRKREMRLKQQQENKNIGDNE